MPTLLSGLWVACVIGGYQPRHFTPYFLEILEAVGLARGTYLTFTLVRGAI